MKPVPKPAAAEAEDLVAAVVAGTAVAAEAAVGVAAIAAEVVVAAVAVAAASANTKISQKDAGVSLRLLF